MAAWPFAGRSISISTTSAEAFVGALVFKKVDWFVFLETFFGVFLFLGGFWWFLVWMVGDGISFFFLRGVVFFNPGALIRCVWYVGFSVKRIVVS